MEVQEPLEMFAPPEAEAAQAIQSNKMGVQPEGRLLFTMSLPVVISMLLQALYSGAVLHVAALDLKPHAVQNLCQRGHGDSADAAQMDPLAGIEIFMDAGTHRCSSKMAEESASICYFTISLL